MTELEWYNLAQYLAMAGVIDKDGLPEEVYQLSKKAALSDEERYRQMLADAFAAAIARINDETDRTRTPRPTDN